MRYQHLEQVSPIIVDEDSGIPTKIIDEYQSYLGSGPVGPKDPRTLLLSMSEYDKSQDYDVYDYNTATRSDQNQGYTPFVAAHQQQFTHDYSTHAQAHHATALPYLAPGTLDPHDTSQYYAAPQAYATTNAAPPTSTSTYLEQIGPRQLPEILQYSPSQGVQGVKTTILFRSQYDLSLQPQSKIYIMFGHKRCDSVLSKTSHTTSPYQYAIQAPAPSLSSTGSTSSQSVTLALAFEGPMIWQAPSLDVGSFTYLDQYALESPPAASRKRKLSTEASERLSPAKKQPLQQRESSQSFIPERQVLQAYGPRRFSQADYNYNIGLPRVQTQQQYYTGQPASASARLQTEQSPVSYDYYSSMSTPVRETNVIPASRSAQLLPSPSGNPPLIRTSTIHPSPPTPGLPVPPSQTFNPYTMYPANTKAMLKIEGELNSMVDGWTSAELEARRRLVQFQRSQQGSIITTTFGAVTPEERAPNSICVSCIWWAEKQECYVTSVDSIQLLESLVAVRFTVEEKNRIRRNLEGFRPATVSKTKADSEDFFKLIMGFPNPKPRNIEKDVKVFPWRILSTALKKIIGKYSASYSSTAGALHTPAASSYASARLADAGMEQRSLASPRSTTSSSAASHGQSYASVMTSQSYLPHSAAAAPIVLHGGLSAGPPDLRLSLPHAPQSTSWHPSPMHYGSATTDLSTTTSTARTPSSWDYASGMTGYSMTGLPGSSTQYNFGTRIPSMLGTAQALPEARFIPLQDYEQHGQPTTTGS